MLGKWHLSSSMFGVMSLGFSTRADTNWAVQTQIEKFGLRNKRGYYL